MDTLKEYIYEGFIYKLYVPDSFTKEKNFPLIVMLHGCDQDSDQLAAETKINLLAAKEQFIVLYPMMNRRYTPLFNDPHKFNPAGCWNWFLDGNQQRGEGLPKTLIGMIFDAKKRLNQQHNITVDSNKIYAVGFSAGGAMANILGVTYPDLFSGIAICSGLPYGAANTKLWKDPWNISAETVMKNGVKDPYECGNKAFLKIKDAFVETGIKRTLPLIVFQGMKDMTVHPKNAQQIIIQWAQMHFLLEGGQGNINLTPDDIIMDQMKNGSGYRQHKYHDKNGNPFMELWLVNDMGHGWSGGDQNGIFTDPSGPDATSIIWAFLQKTASR